MGGAVKITQLNPQPQLNLFPWERQLQVQNNPNPHNILESHLFNSLVSWSWSLLIPQTPTFNHLDQVFLLFPVPAI